VLAVPTAGTIIRATRNFRRIKQDPFAKAVGISVSTLYRLEHDDPRVQLPVIARAARELNLEFDMRTGTITPPPDVPFAAYGSDELDSLELLPPVPAIPEWTVEICASAWIDIPICQLDPDDPQQRAVIEAGRFRLRIVGKCMEPDYQDGQVIEFQLIRWDHATPLEIGADYVVCRSDGMATFKRLVKVDEDTLSLAALNQRDYPGLLVVHRQEVVRLARVAFRLVGPPPARVPRIAVPK